MLSEIPQSIVEQRERFIRPSSLTAIAACPGRPTMEVAVVQVYGEPEAAPEANLGHDLHARCQQAVATWADGLVDDLDDVIADTLADAEADGVDRWSIYCLRFALETVRDLVAKHGIEREHVLVEHRLDMASVGFANGGTADVVLVVPHERVIVIDYKMGFIDQGDAADHDQTQAYAASAAETFDAPEVLVYLIQPRAEKEHRVPPPARYDADTLRQNRAWTSAVIRRARAENPELCPGLTQCQHCKALAHCPAVEEEMYTIESLDIITVPDTPYDLGKRIGLAKLAEKWADAVKDRAKAALIDGAQATGWKLGAGRSIKSIPDAAQAVAILERQGISLAEIAAAGALSLTPGSLPPDAAEVIGDLIVTGTSAPSLVQDKRSKNASAA